ncbi:MAG TPA: phospholipase D-like domain-containing protein [Ignavibacteria bacterium]|nr:phospholipase D-like domain-containing protein [Ignavibacteria bacterium]HMQ98936.1 phospholipase D-like domain-containing protein [Ignavibacteria bacterium]
MIETKILEREIILPGLHRNKSRKLGFFLAKISLILIILTSSIYSQQNNIELVESIPVETTLDNPDIRSTQEVWLEMINSSQKTLDIEQFYISNEKGEPLDTVLNAIVAAAERGVIVRIIVDGEMYRTYPDDVTWMEQQSPNITKHVIDFKSLAGGIQHAKFFIVDGKEVFLGSQNFDWRALKHIHELGLRISGDRDLIRIYSDIFNEDWKYSEINDGKTWNLPIYTISGPDFMIYKSIYGDSIHIKPTISPKEFYHINGDKDLDEIIFMINYATTEITLQFLSYNPVNKDGYWEEVDTALISASKRGVKVRLLVSDWNLGKTSVEHFKELIQYPNFEVRYTEIPDHSGGFIPYARVEHCKFITADSVCWIGTSNMSYDYFYESRNVGLVVESGKFTERVRDIFYKSWNSEYARPIESTGEYRSRERN